MIVNLMAQNTDIDIMLVPYYYFTQLLEDKGIYYKMNDSDIICNYIDNCFDYISDGAKLENGDIGFFPVSSYHFFIYLTYPFSRLISSRNSAAFSKSCWAIDF